MMPSGNSNNQDGREVFGFSRRVYWSTLNDAVGIAGILLVVVFCVWIALDFGWVGRTLAVGGVGAGAWGLKVFLHERRQMRGSSIDVDPATGTMTFRGFRFVTGFWPEKRRPEVMGSFNQVIAVRPVLLERGVHGLEVRTSIGRVKVSEEIDRFERICQWLTEIVRYNESDPEARARALAAEPKIVTPGWAYAALVLVLGLIVAVILYMLAIARRDGLAPLLSSYFVACPT